MNLKTRPKNLILSPEFLTGLFVIGAFCILFYFTVIVRGWDIFRGSSDTGIISVRFPNAGTLAVNDKVKVIGVDMGIITSIELADDNNSVLVRMKLRKHIPIYKGYEFSILSSSVFGGAFINIKPGVASNPNGKNKIAAGDFPPDHVFQGLPPIDIITDASELIAAFREDEKYLRRTIIEGGVLDNIRETLKSLEENAKNFNLICSEIKDGKGTLGKLFTDPSFYDKASRSFEDLGRLANRLDALASDVENGKGIAGKLLRDEDAAKEILTFVTEMNAFMKKVNSDKNSFGRLFADNGRFFDDLTSSMKSIAELSASLNKGDGTIGKLIKDEKLYIELRETVQEVRSAIDDFREMAPVATFGNILFGAL